MDETTEQASIGHRLINSYFAFLDRLYRFFRLLSIVLLAIIVVIVTYIVIMRYAFNAVPEWGRESARFLAIYMAFLYSAALVWDDNHLQVESLFQKFSLKVRSRIRIVQLVFIIGLSILMMYYGGIYALDGRGTTSMAAGIPMVYPYSSIPVSGFFFFLFSTGKLIQTVVDPEVLDRDYMQKYTTEV